MLASHVHSVIWCYFLSLDVCISYLGEKRPRASHQGSLKTVCKAKYRKCNTLISTTLG